MCSLREIRRGRERRAPSPARPRSVSRYGTETLVLSPELLMVKVPEAVEV
jgi:hypothetical protein